MTQLPEGAFYRGIGYSVSDLGNGKQRWKLHPKLKFGNEATPIISEEISGTYDDAVAAAKKTIDLHPERSAN
jgi:hypothetical protein